MRSQQAGVSVIIPCYRCSETIERAIASVEEQTVAPAQIILVDDASDDDTADKLRGIAKRLGRDCVQIIELPKNGGPAAARNAGWEAATQPYIAFLDADDSWHPRKIELQYGWMIDHPDVCFTAHCYVQSDSSSACVPDIPDVWPAERLTRRKILLKNPASTPTVMLKRDLPVRFDPEMRFAEDYLLWMRIVLAGHQACHLAVPLTFLHKAPYGEGGLSGNLWRMEFGELGAYKRLVRERLVCRSLAPPIYAYSLAKFLRRVFVMAIGRVRKL